MKTITKLLGLLLLAIPLWAQTPVTVSGLITDAGGNAATNGFVQFLIIPQASGIQFYVSGNNTIAPQSTTCGINASGQVQNSALTGPCQVWGNDVIAPPGTTYKVIFAPGGQITNTVLSELITGSVYSLNNPVFAPSLTITPQQTVIRVNPFQTNIIPPSNNLFTIGSPSSQWAAVYANQFFLNGVALVPIAFGLGTNNAWTGLNSWANTSTFNALVVFNNGGTLVGTFTGAPTLTGAVTFSNTPSFTRITGTPPFNVTSTTLVTNLNANLLNGFPAPTSSIVGINDTQGLTNKTIDASLNTIVWSTNTVGHYLRNNGTQYVDSTILAGDLPATTSNCTGTNFAQGLNAGGTPICTAAPTDLPAIIAYTVTTESSNTALTSGVLTSVNSKSVTFPSSGCPCRVLINWAQYLTTSGSSAVAEALVSDGTVVFAEAEWPIAVNNGVSGTGSGMSASLYANNANVTFTLKIQVDAAGVTAQQSPFHAYGGRNSRLEVSVMPSN